MNTDLIDLICSTRAMRRLKPDPVPPELINQILRAATAAPPASLTSPGPANRTIAGIVPAFMHHYARSRARGFKMTRNPLVIPDLPPLGDTPAPYAGWKPLPAAACQITPLRLRRSRARPKKP